MPGIGGENGSNLVVSEDDTVFGYVYAFEVSDLDTLEFREHFQKADRAGQNCQVMYVLATIVSEVFLSPFVDSLLFRHKFRTVGRRRTVYKAGWVLTIVCMYKTGF